MKNKYIDITSIVQVLGNIYNHPNLLDDDRYRFNQVDFIDNFHQICFSCMYNLYQLGAKTFSISTIVDYLEVRPKAKAEYEIHKGSEYIIKCAEIADINQFNYYYHRMKKMSLLRGYENLGLNLDWIYDPDSLDTKKLQEQSDYLDNLSLDDIAKLINDKIDAIRLEYAAGSEITGVKLGDSADELLSELEATPSYGYPFYTEYMNTITRGMRLGRFYLRSAPTGAGKSRSMIADACYCGCSQMFNPHTNQWESIGTPQPTLYIGTEQDESEVTTMALSFLSGVNEEHILTNNYYAGEKERVIEAISVLKEGKIYFECIPDFTMSDIENTIKRYAREYGVLYHFFDYIHTSAAMLAEIGAKSGIKNLREDNLLFLLSTALKDITVKYGVFIMSSTQLNMSWVDSAEPDQNCLRGSKAVADRLDCGMILLEATATDKEKIKPFCDKNGLPLPNMKLSIYKNRQGQHRGEYLWLNADRGCCRFNGLFLTKWDYTLVEATDIKIRIK